MIWETTEELARRLRCDKEYIFGLMKSGEVPYSVLPGTDQVRFNSDRIDAWLLKHEQNTVVDSNMAAPRKVYYDNVSLVLNVFKCDHKQTTKYTNLYKDRRVFAQLHPSNVGLDLVIKEGSADSQLPNCQILQPVEIEQLSGFWKVNKGWLLGDGSRFTQKKAAAFKIPKQVLNDPKHPGWAEIKSLLDYAKEKC